MLRIDCFDIKSVLEERNLLDDEQGMSISREHELETGSANRHGVMRGGEVNLRGVSE